MQLAGAGGEGSIETVALDHERDLLGQLNHWSFGSAADAIVLPELEPRAVRQRFIVPSIGRGDIARGERSDIRSFEHLFELLNFVNYAFNIHARQYSGRTPARCGTGTLS